MRYRNTLVLLAAVALIATVAGCGGDDEDSDTTAQQTTSAQQAETRQGQGNGGRQDEAQGGSGANSGPGVGRVVENPTKEQLQITPGADNSLQTFGEDPGGEDRDEVVRVMRSYFRALAGQDFAAACERFSEEFRESNEELVNSFRERQDEEPVESCAELGRELRKVTNSGVVAADARKAVNSVILRVGIEEDADRAIIVFRARGGELQHLPMVREDGEWRAFTLSPAPVRAG